MDDYSGSDQDALSGSDDVPSAKPKNFDEQAILVVGDDNTSRTHASRLHKKHETYSTIWEWYGYHHLELLQGLGTTAFHSDKVRLYLVGHGDPDCMKVGGKTGRQAALAFSHIISSRGNFPNVLISIVACYSTKHSHIENPDNLLNCPEDNFAENLHRSLKWDYGLAVRVAGRTSCLWVVEDDDGRVRKLVGKATWDDTRKIYVPDGEPRHKFKNDKIVYWWEGDNQKSSED